MVSSRSRPYCVCLEGTFARVLALNFSIISSYTLLDSVKSNADLGSLAHPWSKKLKTLVFRTKRRSRRRCRCGREAMKSLVLPYSSPSRKPSFLSRAIISCRSTLDCPDMVTAENASYLGPKNTPWLSFSGDAMKTRLGWKEDAARICCCRFRNWFAMSWTP